MKAERLLTASEAGDKMGTETKKIVGLIFFVLLWLFFVCLFCYCCAVCSFACFQFLLCVRFVLFFKWGGVVNLKAVSQASSVNLTGKRFLL